MPGIYNSLLQELPQAIAQSAGMEALLIEVPRAEPGASSTFVPATIRNEDSDAAMLEEGEVDPTAIVEQVVTEPPAVPRPDRIWKFLVNPQSLQFDGGDAEYEQLMPHLSDRPQVAFKGNRARTLEIPDLWLETWFEGRSVQPILDGIQILLKADPDNREYDPPTMFFRWGSRSFGPCKVVKATWREDKWLGGEPAGGRLSLTLLQIPEESVSDPYEPPLPPPTNPETSMASDVPVELTDRQMEDAAQAAKAWLKENATTQGFDAVTAFTLNKQDFKVQPRSDGMVVVAGVDGKEIGSIGVWTGSSILEDWEPSIVDLPKG